MLSLPGVVSVAMGHGSDDVKRCGSPLHFVCYICPLGLIGPARSREVGVGRGRGGKRQHARGWSGRGARRKAHHPATSPPHRIPKKSQIGVNVLDCQGPHPHTSPCARGPPLLHVSVLFVRFMCPTGRRSSQPSPIYLSVLCAPQGGAVRDRVQRRRRGRRGGGHRGARPGEGRVGLVELATAAAEERPPGAQAAAAAAAGADGATAAKGALRPTTAVDGGGVLLWRAVFWFVLVFYWPRTSFRFSFVLYYLLHPGMSYRPLDLGLNRKIILTQTPLIGPPLNWHWIWSLLSLNARPFTKAFGCSRLPSSPNRL